MKENRFTNYFGRGVSSSSGLSVRNILLILSLVLFWFKGFSVTNYPFPQNYQYPHGEIYTSSQVEATVQQLYTNWKNDYYEEGTISLNGQTVDAGRVMFIQNGETGDATVSEGIAYGMLITVYMDNATNNTQDMFDRMWNYYQANSNSAGFMNWKVIGFTGNVDPVGFNENGATDADVDVADALLMAYKQWGEQRYLDAGQEMMDRIWQNEISNQGPYAPVLAPGDAFDDYLNPCYFITNSLQLFNDVDAYARDWASVIDGCYSVMEVSANPTTGLIPDWCYHDGSYIDGIVNSKFESYFLYDAIRMSWRLAHAYAWYGHTRAQALAENITDWAITALSGNPANAVDGYFLDGTPFSSNEPGFSTLGQFHNPCFTGGLGIGAMVNNTAPYQDFLSRTWTEGSGNDPYGKYYTETVQLLYMLTMTGNMPNFWDMKPVLESAITDANGSEIILEFTKDISTTGLSGAASDFTVYTSADETFTSTTPLTVSSVSRSATANNTIVLSFASDIAEPFIRVEYAGTSVVADEDAATVDPFGPVDVENRITNMEPYVITRITNVVGTEIIIKWSKELDPTSFAADGSDFTFTVEGTAGTITGAALDTEDPTKLILTIQGGDITSNAQEVLLSFAGSAVTGTSSNRQAQPFTNAPVQNYYLSVECFTIDAFDPPLVSFSTWGDATWSGSATDPTNPSETVGEFVADPADADINVKGEFSDVAAFNEALNGGSKILKFRMYVSGIAAGKNVRVRIYAEPDPATPNYWGDHMIQEFVPTSTDEWNEYEFDLTAQYNASLTYNWILIQASPDELGSETVYIDDIRVCPADPVVEYSYGRTNFTGEQLELHFSTAMDVPALNAITVRVGTTTVGVTSIEPKQGDASTLILTLESPITSGTSTITVSGGASLAAQDGRTCEIFSNATVLNLYEVTVSTGWRDDFSDETDYITANIGIDDGFTSIAEDETGDGVFTVVANGTSDDWYSMNVTTYSTGANDLRQVLDLTGRETVEIRYRVPSATSSSLFMRIDFKDKANDYSSDAHGFVELPITPTWNTVSFDLASTFACVNCSPIVTVDRTNIYQTLFRFIEAEATAAPWTPTQFDGTIEFDYISIGSALYLYDVTTEIEQGATVSATSTADGTIFLVPGDTPPVLSNLQEAIFDGTGVSIECSADIAATLPSGDLPAGYYVAYAYDPLAGAISTHANVNIMDVTVPIITDCTDGEIPQSASISVTVDEDAIVYLVEEGTTPTLANFNYAVEEVAVTADLAGSISLSNVPVGTYEVYAVDYAFPTNLISAAWLNTVIVTEPELTVSGYTTGTVLEGVESIYATTNRDGVLYLLPTSASPASIADLESMAVASVVTTAGVEAELATTGLTPGNYYIYASAGTDMVGPKLPMVTIQQSFIAITSLDASATTVTVNEGDSVTVEIYFTPTNATDKDLEVTPSNNAVADAVYTTVATNTTDGIITIYGIAQATSSETITVTHAEGFSIDITVNVVCDIAAPALTSSVIEVCEGEAIPAFEATATGTVNWYETDGTPITTGTTLAPTATTAGTYEFVVTQTDGCEGAADTATLIINANPVAEFETPIGTVCSGDGIIELTSYATTGGEFSGSAVSGTVFNPANATEGITTIEYVVIDAVSGCSDTAFENVTVLTTPVALTATDAPNVVAINGVTPYPDMVATATDAAYTIEWYDETGTTLLSSNAEYAHGETAGGPYTFKVRQVNGICASDFRTVTLTFSNCDIAPPVVNTVEACVGDATIADLEATPLDQNTITWYEDAALTTAVSTDAVFAHGLTSGTATYYATQTGHCTSEPAEATVTINALPTIGWTGLTEACSNGAIVTLADYVAVDATFSGDGVNATSGTFDPTSVTGATATITAEYTDAIGCYNSTDRVVTINAAPAVTFTAPEPLCANSTSINLGTAAYVSPIGGTFDFGTLQMTGSTFNPANAEIGANNVIYNYESAEGCTGSATVDITVNALPTVTFDAIGDVCLTGGTVDLSALVDVANGEFVGDGVTAATFDPSGLTGSIDIEYSVTVDGCIGSDISTATIVSTPLPTATDQTNVDALVAVGTDLIWYSDAEGTMVAGTGSPFTHNATVSTTFYVTQTINGCESAPKPVALTISDCEEPAPAVTANYFCVGDAPTSITATGTDVVWYSDVTLTTQVGTGAEFTPTDISEVGTYTYYATQNVTCESAPASVEMTIKALPTVSFNAIDVCPNETAVDISDIVTPAGGEFSGTAVTAAGIFDASVGNPTITYTYTDAFGCTSATDYDVTINAAPSVSVEAIPAVCQTGSSVSLVDYVTPTGGTFAGDAVSASGLFNPANAIAGDNMVSYSYEDLTTGCSTTENITVVVNVTDRPVAEPQVSTETIIGLVATGTNVIWYEDADATVEIADPANYAVAQTTTFYVTQTVDGCESNPRTVTYTISDCSLPAPTINGGGEICLGNDWSGFAIEETDVTYAWYSDPQLSTPVGTNQTFSPRITAAGTITVYATQTGTCTSAPAEAQLVVNALPTVTFSTVPEVAEGGSVDLSNYVSPAGGTFESATAAITGSVLSADGSAASNLVTYTVENATTGCTNSAEQTVTVQGAVVITVNAIEFDVDTLHMEDGGLAATFDVNTIVNILPEGAFVSNIAYEVLNPNYATVDANGIVTANTITLGTSSSTRVRVTVTTVDDEVVTESVPLYITQAAVLVNSIEIPETAVINIGDTLVLSANVLPVTANDLSVTWSVNDSYPNAVIDSEGNISLTASALVNDTFEVIATANDGSGTVSDPCTITVVELIAIDSASISIENAELEVGESVTINIVTYPSNTTQSEFNFTIQEGSDVVTVNSLTGEITAIGTGTASILVRSTADGAINETIEVTVIQLVETISLENNPTTLSLNNTTTLISTIEPSGATNQEVEFTSSNPNVIVVNEDGSITAVGEGFATITATSTDGSNVSETITITVERVAVTDIEIHTSPEGTTLQVGQNVPLSFSVYPSDASIDSVRFEFDTPGIVEISISGTSDGITSGTVRTIGNGSVTVTIISIDNPAITESFTVTVSINTNTLQNLYTLALGYFQGIDSGSEVGSGREYTRDQYNELRDAILEAGTILNNPGSSQAEVLASELRLRTALDAMGLSTDPVSIESTDADAISIYPVPFTDVINVEGTAIEAIVLFDANGKIVAKENQSGNSATLNTSSLPNGTYFIQVTTQDGTTTQTIIK